MADVNGENGMFKHYLRYKPDTIFYHYCSTETFRTICETKRLRFSDINMMNDYQEWSYGYTVFEEAANVLLEVKDKHSELKGLDKEFFSKVDKIISPTQLFIHPVMCSFSKNPDMLSQWRAYGDDGCGVVIGFSGETFGEMPVSLMNVEYDRKTQISEMTDILAALYSAEQAAPTKGGQEFRDRCVEIGMYRIAYKNPSFFEEREVRSFHLLHVRKHVDGTRVLVDPGGTAGKRKARPEPVKFRIKGNDLIAYIDIPFRVDDTHQPIKEVWRGPKNDNSDGNFGYMLNGYGFSGYSIQHSKASYR
jgi:hypothetical protein